MVSPTHLRLPQDHGSGTPSNNPSCTIASLSGEGQAGKCLGREHKYMRRSDVMQGINIKKPSFQKGHLKFSGGNAGLSLDAA